MSESPDSSEKLDAEGRIRLYMQLTFAYNFGEELIQDSRFKSETWPRTTYAITRPDLDEVLAKGELLRREVEQTGELTKSFNDLLETTTEALRKQKEAGEENARLHRVLEQVKESLALRDEQYRQLEAKYDKLKYWMEGLEK
jgi:hypothetical protein